MPQSRVFDKAKYRDDPHAIAQYLNVALSTDDPLLIRKAIGDMARAQGASKLSRKVGMTRQDFYRGFSDERSVAFDKAMKILIALDIQLIARPSRQRTKQRRAAAGPSSW